MFNRKQKLLLGIGVAVAASLVVAALWLTSSGQYRTALREYVAATTGHELVVAGEFDLDLLPAARLTVEDARLRNPAYPQELASASVIELDLDRGDLLRGVLTIRELRIEGFHVNFFVGADGISIWDTGQAQETSNTGAESSTAPKLPERIAAEGGRLDVQNLYSGRRFMLKNLQLFGGNVNLQGETFSALANFDLEWFDRANRRTRETAVGLIGNVEADAGSGRMAISDLDLNSPPVLLQGRIDIRDYPDNPSYQTNLTSNEFDARVLLRNLGLLPEREQSALVVPNGDPDGQWPASVNFNLSGDGNGLSAEVAVNTTGQTVIEAETEVRFAGGLAPANIRYEMDIGEMDISAFSEEEEPGAGAAASVATAFPQSERDLPDLENLVLSGSITADALTAGDLRVENLTVYTNIEDRVFDAEVPPVAALGGTLSANMRWNAGSGDFDSELHGEDLAIADLAPLVTRLDVLTGTLHVDGIFSANGRSVRGLLDDLSGDATFIVTENLVDIGLIKQIFTSISALSPNGETIQQWPDLIRFSEVSGGIALDGGLGSDHAFNLRMDNFSAAGTGVSNLQTGQFNYEVLLTLLGEPLTQTIPVSGNYQGVTWPVVCAARFSDDVIQYCRPDFNAAREIFSRIGGDGGSN